MLFRVDFYDAAGLAEQVQMYQEDMTGGSEEVRAEIDTKFHDIIKHLAEIDVEIEAKSQGWDLQRLPKSDITILRLAIYEIIYDANVPNAVAINEAVELSKAYGTDKSASFINGVLATVAKEHTEA